MEQTFIPGRIFFILKTIINSSYSISNAQEDLIIGYDDKDYTHQLTSNKLFGLAFRNPYCSNFKLTEIGAEIDAQIIIANMCGKIHKNLLLNSKNKTIDISDLNNGMYIIQIKTREGILSSSIIKK